MIDALMILGVSLIFAGLLANSMQTPQRQAIRIEDEKDSSRYRRR